ncbi:GTPASe, G3E family [Terrimicrobium sacchariphilum]|uniref:GTPASe, G3E family n=1 Tax=Terrimicrobium sacchariphilum TaxID=690879 RepID=A0A146G236_TERSA|nr:GTP-binding protein [Terrimicrobium sacchariphilum]GAT31583.1 GTPASe, G3E family [Terrimicrobium sacchariphilum]
MTPLVVIVGFLGSGKTTFLKSLLPELKSQGVAPKVIINDYQNAGVDAEQLRAFTEEIRAISGDCVCCGSREELVSSLESFQHTPGSIAVVETNGTTDAEQLIEMLSLEPGLEKFTLPIQISLIDGKRWQKRFWHNALEREQARTAAHVVISRQDVVDAKRVEEVKESLREHKVRGQISDVATVAAELARVVARASIVSARLVEKAGCGCDHDHCEHEGHSHHHHQDSHFSSIELALPELVKKSDFSAFLRGLPDEVIRAKGLVRFIEEPEEFFVFQKVDRFEEPQFFSVGKEPTVRVPLALFIGPEIPEDRLRDGISRFSES